MTPLPADAESFGQSDLTSRIAQRVGGAKIATRPIATISITSRSSATP